MQPKYSELPIKRNARQENIECFRRLTGLDSIPQGREYWTLCNEQPDSDGSEIMQLVNEGILSVSQFHGVDRDGEIIARNKINHPNAHWHNGEWIDVIRDNEFNPSFVYLDTTSFSGTELTARLVTRTMRLCSANTVLIMNAMGNDPRSSKIFEIGNLVEFICQRLGSFELKKWNDDVPCFSYNASGKTEMISYVFYKRG